MSNNTLNTPTPCAAGNKCGMNRMATSTHKCPDCHRNIHAICGREVDIPANSGLNVLHNILCPECDTKRQNNDTSTSLPSTVATTTQKPATTSIRATKQSKKRKQNQDEASQPANKQHCDNNTEQTTTTRHPTIQATTGIPNTSQKHYINAPDALPEYHEVLVDFMCFQDKKL